MSVAVVALKGLVPSSHLATWKHHSALVELLCRTGLHTRHFDKINGNWFLFLTGLKRNFPDRDFSSINFHCGWHWVASIRRFGVPSQFSTGRFEAFHIDVKSWAPVTNNHNPMVDIGLRSQVVQGMNLVSGDYGSFMTALRQQTAPAKKSAAKKRPQNRAGNIIVTSRPGKRYAVIFYFGSFEPAEVFLFFFEKVAFKKNTKKEQE